MDGKAKRDSRTHRAFSTPSAPRPIPPSAWLLMLLATLLAGLVVAPATVSAIGNIASDPFSVVPKALSAVMDLYDGDEDVLILDGGGPDGVGDFNGDGIDDLALNVPDSGLCVYYGATDFSGTKDPLGVEGALPDVTIANAGYGGSARASDLNGDGIDDLVVNFTDVFVVYGSPTLPAAIDIAVTSADVAVLGEGIDACRTPDPVDVNGDGVHDLLVTAPEALGADETTLRAGRAYIVFGSTTLPSTVDLTVGDQDVTLYGPHAHAELTGDGADIAYAGDLNADGIDDLFLMTRDRYHVLYGSSSLPTTVDLALGEEDVTIFIGQWGGRDMMPSYSADVNGDSVDDFIMARGGSGPDGRRFGTDELHVFFGGASLPKTIDLDDAPGDVVIYGPVCTGPPTTSPEHWRAAKPGDFNGDGIADIVLYSGGADGPDGSRWSAGEVAVVYGSPDLPSVIDLAYDQADMNIHGAAMRDYLRCVNTTDVNEDGRDDLILSAYGADGLDADPRLDCGEVYVVHGSPALPSLIDLSTDQPDTIIYGAGPGADLDAVELSGDVNSDGVNDLFLRGGADSFIVFGAAASAPALYLTSPNGGESWKPDSLCDITWQADNLAGDVRIDLHKDGSLVRTLVSGIAVSSGSWTWPVPSDEPEDSDYTVRVVSLADTSVFDESNTTFSIASNAPPLAAPDIYGVEEAATLTISALGLLENDTDPEDDGLTAVLLSPPAHGALTLNADGSFTYVHDGSQYPSDEFTYVANDGEANSELAIVIISIANTNDVPVAYDDAYSVDEGGTLNVTSPDLLRNDTDEERDFSVLFPPLRAVLVSPPAHGTLTLDDDGDFVYVHDHSNTLSDSFTYVANDGEFDGNIATVTITINPVEDDDINGDLAVDAVDIQLVVNEILGMATGYTCDIDNNGATDAIDVQLTINAALGL